MTRTAWPAVSRTARQSPSPRRTRFRSAPAWPLPRWRCRLCRGGSSAAGSRTDFGVSTNLRNPDRVVHVMAGDAYLQKETAGAEGYGHSAAGAPIDRHVAHECAGVAVVEPGDQ